ncbi:multiheme c-type cytochrome [Sulfurimonas sp.]|uniref:multiheme c-type cytochrome n=1 Tax=Sulfurimonas sp. TaxID=2022749 RepID=UPI002B4A8010|nr:multiheme c-type cytochrome [Sulfurimonas sp.]
MKNIHMKIYIILMFVSGIFQLSIFGLSWEYFRMAQAVHILSSAFVAIFLLLPFVNLHTYEYMIIKKAKSTSGVLLGLLLFFIIASGFYLFLVGNRGSDAFGIYSYYTHLYGSFILLFFLFLHAKKKIATNANPTLLLALLLSISYPTLSYSDDVQKLTNIKLEDGVSRYHNEDWTNSAKCKSCHTEIFNQWADSNHRHLTGSNPYYMVMENLAGADMGDEFRQWCMGCHNPSAVTTKQKRSTHNMNGNHMPNFLFESGAKDLISDLKNHGNSRLEQGVSCVTCHRITKTDSKGNSSYSLDLTNRKKYVFEDSNSDVANFLSEKFINSNPLVHKQSYSKELYKKSSYCASCHDEFLPESSKRPIVSTFKEWEKSPFNNPKDPTKHKTCIDCHMTYLKDNKHSPLRGTSTTGGTIKDDIKVHYFAGANHFLSGLKSKEHEDQTIQLLRTSAKVDVEITKGKILVGVKNIGAGHHLPTGVSDFRELWLNITIKDKNSKIVFSSGKLKDDGNLDTDARPFMKVFGDENSKPVGLLFWRYKKLISDTRIPAGKRRVESFDISNYKNLKYPLSVEAKLNFRIYPQWATDIVKRAYPQLPNPPVITLQTVKKEFVKAK